MNSVILMGRLTADPELRTTNNGLNYCRFTVAVDRYSKGEDKKTDFINCVAWRQTAEFVERYFGKGKMIAVQGSIQTGSFTNKDGAKVYTTDVLVDKAHFCGDKREEGQAARAQNAPSALNAESYQQVPLDTDLPF
jgi:single-strand DNA-binding protein